MEFVKDDVNEMMEMAKEVFREMQPWLELLNNEALITLGKEMIKSYTALPAKEVDQLLDGFIKWHTKKRARGLKLMYRELLTTNSEDEHNFAPHEAIELIELMMKTKKSLFVSDTVGSTIKTYKDSLKGDN